VRISDSASSFNPYSRPPVVLHRHECAVGLTSSATHPVKACESLGVDVSDICPPRQPPALIVDALGAAGEGEELLEMLRAMPHTPLVSLDVPLGWGEGGAIHGKRVVPDALVSLGVPKAAAHEFMGTRYLTGRSLPPQLLEGHGVGLPPYEGPQLFQRLNWPQVRPSGCLCSVPVARLSVRCTVWVPGG
jgi:hypothetical protein